MVRRCSRIKYHRCSQKTIVVNLLQSPARSDNISVVAVSALVWICVLLKGVWGAVGTLNGSYSFHTLFTNFAKYMQILVVITVVWSRSPLNKRSQLKNRARRHPHTLPRQTLPSAPSLYQRCGQSVSKAPGDPTYQQH